jgi:hypothetical protein
MVTQFHLRRFQFQNQARTKCWRSRLALPRLRSNCMSVASQTSRLRFHLKSKRARRVPTKPRRFLPFLQQLSLPDSSRPGLSVVMGLVAVAALFSAGAWWGMQVHGKTAVPKGVATQAVAAQDGTARISRPSDDSTAGAPSVMLCRPQSPTI